MKSLFFLICFLGTTLFGQVNEYTGFDPEWDEFVELQEEPRPLNLDEFKNLVGYPSVARDSEIVGKVVVRINLDTAGNYLQHKVLRDPHPILTHAVEQKISTLKFTPALREGKKVRCWITVPIDFQLNGRGKPSSSKPSSPKHPFLVNRREFLENLPWPEGYKKGKIKGEITLSIKTDGKGNYLNHWVVSYSDMIILQLVEPHLPELKFSMNPGFKPDTQFFEITIYIEMYKKDQLQK